MKAKLKTYYKKVLYEAGCDEAGRGCLAGPVFAAAVILDINKPIKGLNDSKILSVGKRAELKLEIEEKAVCYAVQFINAAEIDEINILKASLKAMQKAVMELSPEPAHILIDGKFPIPDCSLPQYPIIKGDGLYQSIAAASILAKTYRDDYMKRLSSFFPEYNWSNNKGYPTKDHILAIQKYGRCSHHRMSFKMKSDSIIQE